MERWAGMGWMGVLMGCSLTALVASGELAGSYVGKTKLTRDGCSNCASSFDFIWIAQVAGTAYTVTEGNTAMAANANGSSLVFSYAQDTNQDNCPQRSTFDVTLSPIDVEIAGGLTITEVPACDGNSSETCQCIYTLSGVFTQTPQPATSGNPNYRE